MSGRSGERVTGVWAEGILGGYTGAGLTWGMAVEIRVQEHVWRH